MAGKFPIFNQMERAQLENSASDLSSPTLGMIYYNTTSNAAKLWNGSVWKTQNPLTTKGDIFTHTTTDSTRLAVGTNGYVLTANSGQPEGMGWSPVSVTNTINGVVADYTILDNDGYRAIFVTTSNTNRTITLPSAAANSGREIAVKKLDSGTGNVTVAGNIDGDAGGFLIENMNEKVNVISNGSQWYII